MLLRIRLRSAVLALSLGVAGVTGTLAFQPMAARAAAPLHFQRGYSVQGSWLCYGWSTGAYHCTQHWYRTSAGQLVSTNPRWVPNGLGSSIQTSPRPMAFSMPAPAVSARGGGGNTAGYPWGQCTWGAAALSLDNVAYLGNARDWLANAQRRGLPTGTVPRAGATVVYRPGVQGASALGHVAHVTAVFANGSFAVREMNYFGFGGGFGIFSSRLSHAGAGVAFIY